MDDTLIRAVTGHICHSKEGDKSPDLQLQCDQRGEKGKLAIEMLSHYWSLVLADRGAADGHTEYRHAVIPAKKQKVHVSFHVSFRAVRAACAVCFVSFLEDCQISRAKDGRQHFLYAQECCNKTAITNMCPVI
jgi:hypothetical protein